MLQAQSSSLGSNKRENLCVSLLLRIISFAKASTINELSLWKNPALPTFSNTNQHLKKLTGRIRVGWRKYVCMNAWRKECMTMNQVSLQPPFRICPILLVHHEFSHLQHVIHTITAIFRIILTRFQYQLYYRKNLSEILFHSKCSLVELVVLHFHPYVYHYIVYIRLRESSIMAQLAMS